MLDRLRNAVRDERGTTTIEYGLIGVLVAAAVVAGASALGGSVAAMFEDGTLSAALDGNATPGTGSGDSAGSDSGAGGSEAGDSGGAGDVASADSGGSDSGGDGNSSGKGKGKGKGKP